MDNLTAIGETGMLTGVRRLLGLHRSQSSTAAATANPMVITLPDDPEPPHRRFVARHWQRFAAATLDTLPADLVQLYAAAMAAPGMGVYLVGAEGRGKTWALVALFDAVCNEFWQAHRSESGIVIHDDGSAEILPSPALWSYGEFVRELKADFEREEGARMYDYFRLVDPLFLDDLGAGRMTPWVSEQIYALFEERGRMLRRTFVTCNHPLSELERVLNGGYEHSVPVAVRDGQRIKSRIAEQTMAYEFTGSDRRLA